MKNTSTSTLISPTLSELQVLVFYNLDQASFYKIDEDNKQYHIDRANVFRDAHKALSEELGALRHAKD